MISYSAIVLDQKSQKTLFRYLSGIIESEINDWDIKCHHSTICLGELPTNIKSFLENEMELHVISIGQNEKVIAVEVSGNDISTNDIPHITLAVNIKNNGRPVDSNSIERWIKIRRPFIITGIVKELER